YLIKMETSNTPKTHRSFLKRRHSSFPQLARFPNKSALFHPEKILVSIFVSRSFQFPHYTRKNGNFAPLPGSFDDSTIAHRGVQLACVAVDVSPL
ncbi:MAG TPA: hypothetical protein VGJ73_05095, partial [Verrucomicrobiae bacterium]